MVTENEVKKIANLSRLNLTDEEIDKFTVQLSKIIEFANKINEVDLSEVEPLYHILPVSNVLREDEIKDSLDTEKVLQNAPDRKGDFFQVPKIIED